MKLEPVEISQTSRRRLVNESISMASLSTPDSNTPLIDSSRFAQYPPLLHRLRYTVMIYSAQYVISSALSFLNLPFLAYPNFHTKSYSSHPDLIHRIFTPSSYKEGDPPLPLYIDIHGGGFAWGSPIVDDKFCYTVCKDTKVLVVSLAYPLAPTHRFPIAADTLTSLVKSVLEDDSLPFDRSKVAIGGFSAGANLAFAVCQDSILKSRIHGLVAFYPPTNFSAEAKAGNGVAGAGGVLSQDQLNMFSWGYVDEGQDLRDPRLSPIFAERHALPPKLCVIGCELDLLCNSAEKMARLFAGREELDGEDELVWEQSGVRWEKVVGEDHAFDQRISFGAEKIRMQKRAEVLHASVGDWLRREVYS